MRCALCSVQCAGHSPKAPMTQRPLRFNTKSWKGLEVVLQVPQHDAMEACVLSPGGRTCGLKTRRTEVVVCMTSAAVTHLLDSRAPRDSSQGQMTSFTSSASTERELPTETPRVRDSNVSFDHLDLLCLAQAH